MPTERGILFKTWGVRAIKEDRKTQTRRVIKALPCYSFDYFKDGFSYWKLTGKPPLIPDPSPYRKGKRIRAILVPFCRLRCPFGVPGDRLWVRETWAVGNWNPGGERNIAICYKADDSASWLYGRCPLDYAQIELFAQKYGRPSWVHSQWKPSIHLPRWASRLTLEITDVRVEKLQDISEEDAVAEGCKQETITQEEGGALEGLHWSARKQFMEYWDSITWSLNPWVWVISFKRLEA